MDDFAKVEEIIQASKQLFKAQVRPFFPTMVNVVSTSDETSRAMKAENQSRRQVKKGDKSNGKPTRAYPKRTIFAQQRRETSNESKHHARCSEQEYEAYQA